MRTLQKWLICYDIRHPKRLVKVHRRLVDTATALQYSVFYFEGNGSELGQLLSEIGLLINKREDDVRAYCLPANAHMEVIGKRCTQEGIVWLAQDLLPTNAPSKNCESASLAG